MQTREITKGFPMLRKFILGMCIILIIQRESTNNVSADSSTKEHDVKAVFLYNFIHFIRWPDTVLTPTSPITLCAIGDSQVVDSLKMVISGKAKTTKTPVALAHLKAHDDLSDCHIAFVSRSEQGNYPRILAPLAPKPVLTVGESDNFIDQGGIIEFYLEDNRVRLRISVHRLRAAQLSATASLLKVAKIVD